MSEPEFDWAFADAIHGNLKEQLRAAHEQIVKLSLENSQLKSDKEELKEFLTNRGPSAHFADCDQSNVACICTVRDLKMQADAKNRENWRLREQYLTDQPMGPQAQQISRLTNLLKEKQEENERLERKLGMADRACVELEARIAELEK